MNKEITIIDLLLEIAKKGHIPEKIKYDRHIYIYDSYYQDYIKEDSDNGTRLFYFLFTYIRNFYNDVVEIIVDKPTEEQQIIEIQSIKTLLHIEDYECDKVDIELNRETINTLITAVKQLDKRLSKVEQQWKNVS